MPLISIGLLQQQQAAISSTHSQPTLPNIHQNWSFIDEFERDSLTPTDAYELYTVSANGAGTGTIQVSDRLRLLTGANIGDDVSVRCSGAVFRRVARDAAIDPRTTMIFNIIFAVGTATSNEMFIGIVNDVTALTALPTTIGHMGMFVDQSAEANFRLSSGNGTTQIDTDSTEAVDTDTHRLQITWNGLNSGLIEYFSALDDVSPLASVTVTSLGVNRAAIHFFEQTEAAATRDLLVFDWSNRIT